MNKINPFTRVAIVFFSLTALTAGSAIADSGGFAATLSGAQEVPAVNTSGTGRIKAKFDKGFTQVKVDLTVRNLIGSATRAHFHCARPGANGPVAFGLVDPGPLAFDGNRVRGTLTNADFTGADCTAAIGRPVNNIAALAFAMRDGLIYINVHSDAFPPGEVRGQLQEKDDD